MVNSLPRIQRFHGRLHLFGYQRCTKPLLATAIVSVAGTEYSDHFQGACYLCLIGQLDPFNTLSRAELRRPSTAPVLYSQVLLGSAWISGP